MRIILELRLKKYTGKTINEFRNRKKSQNRDGQGETSEL